MISLPDMEGTATTPAAGYLFDVNHNNPEFVDQYLRNTIDLSLTLEADTTTVMKWWIDALFGGHSDMRSHTGGVLALGKGAAYASSQSRS
jgi:hypothetical protein